MKPFVGSESCSPVSVIPVVDLNCLTRNIVNVIMIITSCSTNNW